MDKYAIEIGILFKWTLKSLFDEYIIMICRLLKNIDAIDK